MNNGTTPGRAALIAAGASVGVIAAGVLVAEIFSVSGSGRIALAVASLVAAAEAWIERLHPSERARVRAELDASVRTGDPFSREERIVRPDGEARDLLVWGRAVLDGAGKVAGLAGAAQDITDVRRAEREIAA